MKHEIAVKLHSDFEHKKIDMGTGAKFWLARDLQTLLGYSQWRNFEQVIEKARVACKKSDHNNLDHFADTGKVVDVGSVGKREI